MPIGSVFNFRWLIGSFNYIIAGYRRILRLVSQSMSMSNGFYIRGALKKILATLRVLRRSRRFGRSIPPSSSDIKRPKTRQTLKGEWGENSSKLCCPSPFLLPKKLPKRISFKQFCCLNLKLEKKLRPVWRHPTVRARIALLLLQFFFYDRPPPLLDKISYYVEARGPVSVLFMIWLRCPVCYCEKKT